MTSTPRAGRRAETTQESRRLLITAATELFAERGYRQTTFEDIAARSGISRGSIPWHFGNKEGLLGAVVDHAVVRPLAGEPDTLDEALDTLVAFTRSPSTKLFATLVGEAVEPGSAPHKWYADLHESLRRRISTWLGRADLPADVNADELATVVLGAVVGIHMQWRIAPDAIDLNRTYDTLGAVLRSVGIT
ncbi:hypothetical protein GCM10022247_53120 [Allokutzneria multivorans]|uniref:HTH tetR-type domain-containing protein n=1 Tax=Allokutzneria multivorans TaxID=1142134 RepID=A0ABP7T7R4_9PSEU